MLRLGRGTRVRPARAPAVPLQLFSYEASPASRLVRDRLCVLEIPYELYSVGVNRPITARLARAPEHDEPRVPWLIDPNEEVEVVGHQAVLAHLERHYARAH